MKLYISEAAAYAGLENDTLRYYESLGLVNPQRDPDSGYRVYDDWDLHFLTDAKWYRSFDFPLSDVVEIVNSDSIADITEKCQHQEAVLQRTINEYQDKLTALSKHLERINRIRYHMGKLSWTYAPPIVFQSNAATSDPELIRSLHRWQNLFPRIDHSFMITREEIDTLGDKGELQFGFSIHSDEALKHGIEPVPPAIFIDGARSVYTVFKAKGPSTFVSSFRKNVLAPIEANGLTITGPIRGNIIVRHHTGEELERYFEVWVPAVQTH